MIGQSAAFTATLQNDTQNQGVTWALSGSGCSGATCGTLTNVTTTSVTYNAPATAPSSTVTLRATSVANASKSASATITVTAPGDFCRGQSYLRFGAGIAVHWLHGNTAKRHAESRSNVVAFRAKLFRGVVRHADERHHDFCDIQRSGHRAELNGYAKSYVGRECREVCFRDDHGYHATSDFCGGEPYIRFGTGFAVNRIYGDAAK